MKSLFNYADRYMEKADWKDLSLIKACVGSMGIVIGTSASYKVKRPLKKCAKFVFTITCIPLMIKALIVLLEGKSEVK